MYDHTRLSILLYGYILINYLMAMPSPLHAQWEADRKISTAEVSARLNENMGRCLAASGDTLHVVWWDSNNNGSAIFYKHSYDAGTSWSADQRLTDIPGSADFPSIAVSGAIVHIAYRDTSNTPYTSYYKRSRDGGNTWETKVSLGEYYWWPSISYDGSSVYVALNSNSPGNSEVHFRRSTDNGTSWENVIQISNASGRSEDPTIAAGGGSVHFAWNDNRTGIMQTFYRRSSDNGSTWGQEVQLTHSTLFAYCPLLHVTGSHVDLAWGDRRSGNYNIFFLQSADEGSTWGPEKQLTFTAGTSVYPVIARDGSNIHLVYWTMNEDVYYLYSSDGGFTWKSSLSLVSAGTKPGYPYIAASGSMLHVIWVDQRDGHSAIYYKRNPTGNLKSMNSIGNAARPIASDISFNAYPNPFSQTICIEFNFQSEPAGIVSTSGGETSFNVYDIFGRKVLDLSDRIIYPFVAGNLTMNSSQLPSPGIYYCRFTAGSESLTKMIVLLK